MAQKFYVVWSGRQTGVFTDWATTQKAVDKYAGARFKSFPSREQAEEAFARGFGIASANSAGTQKPSAAAGKRKAALVLELFDVSIYCDGACDPNPGHAGSGIVVYRAGILAELWFGLYNPRGTNNTAELSALCQALRMAEAEVTTGHTVEVCSDSAYSINCIRSWAPNWEKKGWKKPGGDIKNLEIIQACHGIYQRIENNVSLTHVAGHAGVQGNELADRMAMLAAQRKEKELRRYRETMDIPTLLKMRAG